MVARSAVLERVLADGKMLEEEVRAGVAHFFVVAEPEVPLVSRRHGRGLEAGAAWIAEMHVLGLVLRCDRELDLDLVAEVHDAWRLG